MRTPGLTVSRLLTDHWSCTNMPNTLDLTSPCVMKPCRGDAALLTHLVVAERCRTIAADAVDAPVQLDHVLEISAIDVLAATVELHAALDLVAAGALQEQGRVEPDRSSAAAGPSSMALFDDTFVKPRRCCRLAGTPAMVDVGRRVGKDELDLV